MKKRQLLSFFLIVLLLIPVSCLAEAADHAPLKIAVSSDLHMQNPTALSGLVNPLVPMNREINEALLWTVSEDDADILLLCGDITNSGSLQQHNLLIEKLQAAQEVGLKIMVVPGNHDIGWTSTDMFASLYQNFGYGDAFSRDPVSLSYSVLLENRMFIILDTGGYESNHNPRIKTGTIPWLQNQLQQAQDMNMQVICAGHYPLLTRSVTFDGCDKTIAMLQKYDVRLYLCGHQHGRRFAANGTLNELVIDQSISSPCNYAMIEWYEDGTLRYTPKKIEVTRWAIASGRDDAELLNFDGYQHALALERHEELVNNLAKSRGSSPESIAAAKDFMVKFLEYNANGTMYLHTEELSVHPGYAAFMEDVGVNSNYDAWIPGVLANAVPYTAGFIIDRDGNLLATDE